MINLARHTVGNPFAQSTLGIPLGGVNPFYSQMGGFAVAPFSGINPINAPFASQFGTTINPLAAQYVGTHPAFLQTQLSAGLGASGQWGAGQPVGSISPNVVALTAPVIVCDPVTGALFVQQLPVRSLISAPQTIPFQSAAPGLTSPIGGQWVDPYSAFAQAQLGSQFATNPIF